MGCMVGPSSAGLRKRFPYVDVFMRPQQYHPLIELIGGRLGLDVDGCLQDLAPVRPRVATHVPVIHGCDEFCSFCIIPYRRGRQKSRPVEDVAREVELLVHRGVREVTLLGQTVDAYGHDLPERPDLADLLEAIHDVEGLERIRFLTSHPNYMSDRIIEAVAGLPKVCEHVNLPFQAGDDRVLRDMRRGYACRRLPPPGGPHPGRHPGRLDEHGRHRGLPGRDGRRVPSPPWISYVTFGSTRCTWRPTPTGRAP